MPTDCGALILKQQFNIGQGKAGVSATIFWQSAAIVGAVVGGWLADRTPKLGRLYWCILAAALYLLLAVFICEPLAYQCLRFKLALGALLVSTALFFVPLTLLATTAPFLVRMLTLSVTGVGRQMGRLSGMSTLGSVAGTILIGYVLIPFLPNSITMILTAFLLIIVVAGYALGWGRFPDKQILTAGILIGTACGYGGIKAEADAHRANGAELYHANSNFGMMQVWQSPDGGRRYYLNDFLTQNTYDPAEKKSISAFSYMLAGLARVYTPRIQNVLCIGLGVGIVPMDFARSGAQVDVVEINPAVIPLAEQFFGLEAQRLNIRIGDGRYFLNACKKTYDAIILDAFLGDSSPSHLLTHEAFSAMRRILNPGGTLVINSFTDFAPGRDFFGASLDMTLRSVFRSVLIHDGGNGNVYFVGSDQAPLSRLHPPEVSYVHPSCHQAVMDAYENIRRIHPGRGMVLTDDYNPVEFFDAANREQLRRNLALSMRW